MYIDIFKLFVVFRAVRYVKDYIKFPSNLYVEYVYSFELLSVP